MAQQVDDVFEFEGDQVSDFLLAVPALRIESDGAYPRGTTLNVRGEFRVRSVRIEEDRKGNLTRHHVLAAEVFRVTSHKTPAQRRAEYDAEEAELQAQREQVEATATIQEHPGNEDAISTEVDPADLGPGTWETMTEEEKIDARREAVAGGDPSESSQDPDADEDFIEAELIDDEVQPPPVSVGGGVGF